MKSHSISYIFLFIKHIDFTYSFTYNSVKRHHFYNGIILILQMRKLFSEILSHLPLTTEPNKKQSKNSNLTVV